MAALVQTIPQQTSTLPIIQTLPTTSPSTFAPTQTPQFQTRKQNMSWNSFSGSGGSGPLRGTGAVAPYAFTCTPDLTTPPPQNRQSRSVQLRPEHRTSSASSVPHFPYNATHNPPRYSHNPAVDSVSSSSSSNSFHSHLSRDDSAIVSSKPRGESIRPLSMIGLPTTSSSHASLPTVARPTPDRYRRATRRVETLAGASVSAASASTSVLALTVDSKYTRVPASAFVQDIRHPQGHARVSSADNAETTEKPSPELAKRYRRRSWAIMDTPHLANIPLPVPGSDNLVNDFRLFESIPRPQSAHSQSSIQSTYSSNDAKIATLPAEPAKSEMVKPKHSPLSQSSTGAAEMTAKSETVHNGKSDNPVSTMPATSPATQRLAEISKNDSKKGRGRLRRAFSFGSAGDLLKASTQSGASQPEALAAEQARRERLKEELGDEQAAIAIQQEASGLGENIYSNSNVFSGSTDNLSISSTASSASIMLRKMGRGMKRSTRSLVGLFRPKSLGNTTTSADNAAVEQPMAPQLSVVNIEVERKSGDVNPQAKVVPLANAEFPKVQTLAGSIHEGTNTDKPQTRKSIVGGDTERAAVLAAVRKGILKKTQSDTGTSSPLIRPSENGSESPHSSAPSTPEDPTRSGQRRRESVAIAGEDYFLADGRFTGPEAKSAPLTPHPPVMKNIVFNPRIQFHETWPSGEYDRRGDIATCNRLTPLLAQQIKEELNNFKMEMEVHETSKIYTHFL